MALEQYFEHKEFNRYLENLFDLYEVEGTKFLAETPVEFGFVNDYPETRNFSYRSIVVNAKYKVEVKNRIKIKNLDFIILHNSGEDIVEILPDTLLTYDTELNKMTSIDTSKFPKFIEEKINNLTVEEKRTLEKYLAAIHSEIENIKFNSFKKNYKKEIDSFNIKDLELINTNEVTVTVGIDKADDNDNEIENINITITKRLDDLIDELTERRLILENLPEVEKKDIEKYIVKNDRIFLITPTGLLLEEKNLLQKEEEEIIIEELSDEEFEKLFGEDDEFDFEFDILYLDFPLI